MKVQLKDAVAMAIGGNVLDELQLEFDVSYWISRISRKCSSEYKTFEETKKKYIEKHKGILNEKTMRYEFENKDEEDKYSDFIEKTLSVEIEIADINQLSKDKFKDIKFTKRQMDILFPFIQE